eukprot:5812549-Pleurochrysis_carterae.AAC.2
MSPGLVHLFWRVLLLSNQSPSLGSAPLTLQLFNCSICLEWEERRNWLALRCFPHLLHAPAPFLEAYSQCARGPGTEWCCGARSSHEDCLMPGEREAIGLPV